MLSIRGQALLALGNRLRELRRGTGMTGRQFAVTLGWYGSSRVSKLELGQQLPTEEDLRQWVTACGALPALPELQALLYTLDTFYQPYARQVTGVHAREEELLDLESRTATFRVFAPAEMPDLLQTHDYTRSALSAHAALYRIPATLEDAQNIRSRRQDQLHAAGKEFRFLIAEQAICRSTGDPEVMIRQAEKLLVLSTLGNVRIGIIPARAPVPAPAAHSFTIHDSTTVYAETTAAAMRLTSILDISTYERSFDLMAANALHDGAAQHYIRTLARSLVTSDH